MVVFQAVAWDASDIEDQYTITSYGRTAEGYSVALSFTFKPYFFIDKESKIHNTEAYQAKDLWGFQNSEKRIFYKISFDTMEEYKKTQWSLVRKGFKIYEANIEPILRFLHRTGIQSAGWIDTGTLCIHQYLSNTKYDLFCQDWKSLCPVQCDDIAPLRIMSFDIECYSDDGSFPNPNKPDNVVFQIAMTTKTFGGLGDTVEKVCLCLKETHGHEWYKTERELLERFGEYMRECDPDIVTGWNIFGFDLEYLICRMQKIKCNPYSHVWGRRKNKTIELVEKKLASGALGSNILKMVPMTGRYVFDLFHDVKREHKLESYSLNNVSKTFLKSQQKNDMPVKEIFSRYAEGDPVRLAEVAEYCIQDTILPHLIMEELYTIQNLIEMAKATWVPLSYLSERGQQIKVFSQIARKARELNFLIPTNPYGKSEGKFEGATVLEAQTGAYYTPITALDFEGLYPSIMVAHNLCYSSIVLDKKYDNLPGVQYETFGENRFAQNVPSLLPEILKELKQFRKKAKADMKNAIGTPLESIYNGRQLSYKISMNSVYGFTGATGGGMLPMVQIASTVTMRGRQMIEETKNYIETNFEGAKVRYGDSVLPETPVLIRENGIVKMKSINELSSPDCWEEYPGFWKKGTDKNSLEIYNTDAWTHKGWQPIKRVIRHKCAKKIYRILTHTGLVDVTEDHSLLTPDVELVKPTEVWEGRELLHSWPEDISTWTGKPDGQEVNFGGEYDPFFKIFDTKETLQNKYPKKQCFQLTHKYAQIVYMKLKKLGYNVSLNINPSNNAVQINWSNAPLRRNTQAIKKISVLHEAWDGYVYDLETGAGTFQAGVGQMIVKNTDSVMVEFDTGGKKGQEAIDCAWAQGELAAEQCTKLFKAPNNLELEKVYCPYFLYSKKRYAAKMYEKEGTEIVFQKIDIKGLQVVRRDNCPYVREVCKKVLDHILNSSDPLPAIEEAKSAARLLLAGNVPMEKLLLSKSLSGEYKSPNHAHVAVRDKIMQRAPGSEPKQGDRVQYVIVEGPKKAKLYEKSEDPEFVCQNGIKLDYNYYFTNQLKNPICDLLEPLIGDANIF